MNSNNKSLTQSLEISARFCTPYTGSWLASKEEIEKAVQLKKDHDRRSKAQVAKMIQDNSPAIHLEHLFSTPEEMQQAQKEIARHRDYVKAKLAEMLPNLSRAIHQDPRIVNTCTT